MKHLRLSTKFILFALWILAAGFRLYQLDWDQGRHLHPDERAIIMAVVKLDYPHSIGSFFSAASPWNPHFFAYGSLPFYLLKLIGDGLGLFNPLFAGYDLINIAGRFLSAMFDLGTVLLLFFLGKRLFGTLTGFLASFFYSVSVLPIQLSHFYAVDTLLTFFVLMTLYQLIRFYEHPNVKRSLLIGLFFGFALSTKISALVLLISIGATLAVDFLLLFFRQPHKPHVWFPHVPAFVKHFAWYGFLIGAMTLVTVFVCEPYVFIDFQAFWLQTQQQSEMTHNAFIFPYTLQYVGKIPYWYELKNVFLWGLGPLLGIWSFIGSIRFLALGFYQEKSSKWTKELILITFFLIYFLLVGRFAVGFMRYMLPIYPLFALFAANLLYACLQYFQLRFRYLLIVLFYCGVLLLLWPLSFSKIYSQPNTRMSASYWIGEHIPAGKVLAIEHWDDGLPLFGAENYQMVTLPLYDPDTEEKWTKINQDLKRVDYIIIASNRLYTPLQKLTNCASLPAYKCYPQTAWYYRQLFSGQLGFEKVAEFTDYPRVPFLNLAIDDQGADESFTVYDHPKVMIFKKKI